MLLAARGSVLAIVIGTVGVREAHACSLVARPTRYDQQYSNTDRVLPANALVPTSWLTGTMYAGSRDLEPDAALGARLGFDVAHLRASSITTETRWCLDHFSTGECARALVFEPASDTTAPSAATVETVVTTLVRNPSDGGGFGCPDVDSLVVTIRGTDDRTTRNHLGIVVYTGATDAAASAAPNASVVAIADTLPGMRTDTLELDVMLGLATGHQRNGSGLSINGPVCFTVALMDEAGNVGGRSAATCLDTTNANDPTVVWAESHGCDTAGGAGLAGAAWVALGTLVRRRRTKR